MGTAPTYSQRIVAFIDIVAFKHIIKSLDDDPKMQKTLFRVLSEIHTYTKHSQNKDSILFNTKVFRQLSALYYFELTNLIELVSLDAKRPHGSQILKNSNYFNSYKSIA